MKAAGMERAPCGEQQQADIAIGLQGRLAGQERVMGQAAATAPGFGIEVAQRRLDPVSPDRDPCQRREPE
jgi:hypothetical protein